MENELRRDLIISGSASTGGGSFKLVKISGTGKVSGDLDCIDLRCNGSSDINGNVTVKHVRINGSCAIKESLNAENAEINGQTSVGGQAQINKLRVHGKMKINGNVCSEEMDLKGSLVTKGDVQAEHCSIEGTFDIGGLLNAGSLILLLHGNCRAREIGGEKIDVRGKRQTYLSKLFKSMFQAVLSTDTIEGDELHLEYTKAKIVRGNKVTIGPGCDIGQVEYQSEFHVDKASKVQRHTQV